MKSAHAPLRCGEPFNDGCRVRFFDAKFNDGCKVEFSRAEFQDGCQVDFFEAEFNAGCKVRFPDAKFHKGWPRGPWGDGPPPVGVWSPSLL